MEYGLTAKIRMSMGARERGYVGHMLNAIHWRQIPITGMWKKLSYLEMPDQMLSGVPEWQ